MRKIPYQHHPVTSRPLLCSVYLTADRNATPVHSVLLQLVAYAQAVISEQFCTTKLLTHCCYARGYPGALQADTRW